MNRVPHFMMPQHAPPMAHPSAANPESLAGATPTRLIEPRVNSGMTQKFTSGEAQSLLRITRPDCQPMTLYIYWDPYKNNPNPTAAKSSAIQKFGFISRKITDAAGLEVCAIGRLKMGTQSSYNEFYFDIPFGQLIAIPITSEQAEVVALLTRPVFPEVGNFSTAGLPAGLAYGPLIPSASGPYLPIITADYTQPAIGATVDVTVNDTTGAAINQFLWVPSATNVPTIGPGNYGGIYKITAIPVPGVGGTLRLENTGVSQYSPYIVSPGGTLVHPIQATMVDFQASDAGATAFIAVNNPQPIFLPAGDTLPSADSNNPGGFVALTGIGGHGDSVMNNAAFAPTRRMRITVPASSHIDVGIPWGASNVRALTDDTTNMVATFDMLTALTIPLVGNAVEPTPIPLNAVAMTLTNADAMNPHIIELVFGLNI